MPEPLLNPPGINDYFDYFRTLLSISGVLLGLAFTALIFVIQSGFASFKFSRRMFLELYAVFGRNLLITLSYLTLASLGVLYLGTHNRFLSIGYYLFALIFIKSLLDYYKHRGYLHTLFSTKFVPGHYGKFRSYFRYIKNLGFFSVLFLLIYLFVFTAYPIVISFNETDTFFVTTKGYFYSTLILLTYSIIQIVNFIPEFFRLSNMELESRIQTEEQATSREGTEIDYVKEKSVLSDYLTDHGFGELSALEPSGFLDGTLYVGFLHHTSTPEAWFNIMIEVRNSSVFEIRDAVCDYAYKTFKLLHNSMVDINSFVLSFHIRIEGEPSSRNIFFRSTRSELDAILTNRNRISAVMEIKNKLFDELFRGLPSPEA